MVKIPKWYVNISSWPGLIAEITDIDIGPTEVELIKSLAIDIATRWRALADATPVPNAEFKRLYKANEQNAKAVIVAILELVEVVGAGKPLQSMFALKTTDEAQ